MTSKHPKPSAETSKTKTHHPFSTTNRRGFLALTGVSATAVGFAGVGSAAYEIGESTDDLEDYTGQDVVEIQVGGDDGENLFEPAEIRIDPGTTVHWSWVSGSHDLYPEDIPARSDWTGVDEREEPDYEHLHTFVHPGEYEYVCTPHEDDGMVGRIVVTNDYDVADYTGKDEVEIQVGGDDGENVFEPNAIVVDAGTTVNWEWESGNHNIVPTEMPDDCGWGGVEDRYEPPYDHEWTFDVPGRYGYVCTPHEDDGMAGMIFVLDDRTDEDIIEVSVGGDDGENVFDPEFVKIDPGTTIDWNWVSGNHDLVPKEYPVRSDWEGVDERHEPDYDHLHTFVHPGAYEYVCSPHVEDGMIGTVFVTNDYDVADYTGQEQVDIQVGGEDGENLFDPDAIMVDAGTTVHWEWESGNHNIVPTEMPDDCGWDGVADRYEPEYDHEWTFEVPGRYGYVCTPHEDDGMAGMIFVMDDRTGEPATTIDVGGPDGENIFEPELVTVDSGTTVTWDWVSGNHNLVPIDIPDDCGWEGVEDRYEPEYDHEWTFEIPGEYKYLCTPHDEDGMYGTLLVTEDEVEMPEDEMDDDDEMDDGEMDDDDDPAEQDDAAEPDEDGIPGPGIVGTVGTIGGVTYFLKRRLERDSK